MKKEAQTMKKQGVQGEVKERICQRERQSQDAHGRRWICLPFDVCWRARSAAR